METRPRYPTTKPDDSPKTRAYHEAGHAVLQAYHGLPFHFVTIVGGRVGVDLPGLSGTPNGTRIGGGLFHDRVDLRDLDAGAVELWAVIGAAGVLAEQVRRRIAWPGEPEYRRLQWEKNNRHVWDADKVPVAEHAALAGVTTAAVIERALDELNTLWPAVDAVAGLLLEHGTLGYDGVVTVIQKAADMGLIEWNGAAGA